MKGKKIKLISFIALLAVLAFLFSLKFSQAQTDTTTGNLNGNGSTSTSQINNASPDAIGVRIVPNPNHYSLNRWYASQGFAGSPQALTVDGYEAIRDGRTVYVNAANIDPGNKTIYTNIYLISYNQNSAAQTVDILGQIIAHWKFNGNLTESSSPLPSCAISSLSCLTKADCQSGQVCATATTASSSCQLLAPKNCLTDTDCPVNFFCDSVKAKITRDIKRVGQLEELKEALFSYKSAQNHYPTLNAGTYLIGHSVSVWPSWTETFLSALPPSAGFLDPINRLGACPGYDNKTCWKAETKKFVYDPTPTYLMLPASSYGFVYKTDANGSNYSLCAVLESRELGYHFSPNDPASSACVTATGILSGGQATNTPPYLVDKNLNGIAGQEFSGFVKVLDRENNPLTWTFSTASTNWSGWKNNNNNNQPPILVGTNNPSQKKIYAQNAGAPGTYNATLIVTDGQGGTLSTVTPLVVSGPAPVISAEDGYYELDQVTPLAYHFIFSGANITNAASSYNVTLTAGPFDVLNLVGMNETFSSAGINKYRVDYSGLIPTSHKFYQDTDFSYRITVTDRFNVTATKNFTIHVGVIDPLLDFNCPTNARLNGNYNCFIGFTTQGNHTLSYTSGGALPAGLLLITTSTIVSYNRPGVSWWKGVNDWARATWQFLTAASPVFGATGLPPAGISGLSVYLKGQPTATSSGTNISLKATNEYGASSTRAFVLRVNNYCGDGQKQTPNLEGRGGIYNDGWEDCDGQAGVTLDVAASNPALQYGCQTEAGTTTPNPILSNNYCVFKSPLNGGGFCGDTYCENKILVGGVPTLLETPANCPNDCSATCTSDCNGKVCGDDGCGGTCGACPTGQTCDSVTGQCSAGQRICDYDNVCEPINGEDCGTCPADCTCSPNQTCQNNHCVANCTPNCQTGLCGSDGCGGTCACAANQICKDQLCCTFMGNSCVCGIAWSSVNMSRCGGRNCCDSSETCCNGSCVNDPNHQKTPCGNTCCNSNQYCCDGACLQRNPNGKDTCYVPQTNYPSGLVYQTYGRLSRNN